MGVGSFQKRISFSKASIGRHVLYNFGSPTKITKKGLYHVLMINTPWMVKYMGIEVEKDCFPNNLAFIKRKVKHFYLISIVAY